MTRDEAIEAAYRELNGGPQGVTIYRADIECVLAAAVPVLLNDLADRIDKLAAKWRVDDRPNHWADGVEDAAVSVRAAAEGWGA